MYVMLGFGGIGWWWNVLALALAWCSRGEWRKFMTIRLVACKCDIN